MTTQKAIEWWRKKYSDQNGIRAAFFMLADVRMYIVVRGAVIIQAPASRVGLGTQASTSIRANLG
jgi:hypothetical protein